VLVSEILVPVFALWPRFAGMVGEDMDTWARELQQSTPKKTVNQNDQETKQMTCHMPVEKILN